MKRLFVNFARYQIRQGFFKGALIYLKSFKRNGVIKIKPSTVLYPIWLRANTSDFPVFDEIFVAKQYEFEYGFVPKIIIDCGANIGLAAVFFKNRFPEAQIISIEPEASNFLMLEKNVSAYKDVHCINAGIWSRKISLKGSEKFGTAKWIFSVEKAGSDIANDSSIPAITIESIFERYNLTKVDILKIDIEGAELELFSENTESWLPRVRCIIIELHDRLRKGTGTSFFKAISKHDFVYFQKGVNMFCFNNNYGQ